MLKKILVLSEDTFFRGAFCGLIAGIIKDFISYAFDYFNLQKFPYWGFASVIAFTEHGLPLSLIKDLVGIVLELSFCSLLGLLFVIIAQNLKTKHYICFGVFYGSFIFFFIKAAILGFNITLLKNSDIIGPIITWALSILYGIILTLLERRLSPKTS